MEDKIKKSPEVTERHRRLNRGWWVTLIVWSSLSILLAINQIFLLRIFGFMPISNGYYYYILALYLPWVYIIFPATRSAPRHQVPWYDCLLFLLSSVTLLFFATNAFNIVWEGWEFNAPVTAVIFSIILWVLVLEAARRSTSWPLTITCVVFSIYPLFAGHMPGLLEGFAFTFPAAAAYNAMSLESIIGIPVRTLANMIIGFLIFAVALQHTGGGKFFLNLSLSLFGHTRGGPAKVSVVASGLFGSVSGAAIPNILTTGSMTIPAMKRTGYPPEYAAAIEAVASTGGVLMPPIMGAVAFLMASFLQIPYVEVIKVAAIPAILYYVGLFVQVDGYAAKANFKGLPRNQLPAIGTTLKEGWFYIFTIFALLYFLLYLRLEAWAPFYATAVLFITAMTRKDTRLTLRSFSEFIASFGIFMAEVIGILTAIGLIVGALAMTGVAAVFSSEIVLLAGSSIILLLLFGAITSSILGMGMTISACYIFLAIILAPALVKVGIDPMAAHLFILYWGLVSFLTPPVALSSIVAATIAGAKPVRTGFLSMRLGGTIFFVPFFFVFNPALLLNGPVLEVIGSVLTAILGISILGYGLVGYLHKVGSLGIVTRSIVIICGMLLAFPEWYSDIAGLTILAIGLLYFFSRHFLASRNKAAYTKSGADASN